MHLEHRLEKPGFTVSSIDILKVIRGKNYTSSKRNGRINHGFIYIVKGSLSCRFFRDGADSILLSKGDLMFIPKGCAYTVTYLEDETEIKIIQFDLTDGTLPLYLQTPGLHRLPNAEALVESFFSPRYEHPFYCLSCFYTLLWQLDESHTRLSGKYIRLSPALSHMHTHFRENHPIHSYAAMCGLSEPAFRRLFKEYMGQAPVDHRNALRLNDARIKLQSGEYNVSEAAISSGFSNLSFFIRLYKKKYGYTPKKE